TALSRGVCDHQHMPKKNAPKQSEKTALSLVRTVMAKPRMAESSKKNADTLANGGHMPVQAARRPDWQTLWGCVGGCSLSQIPHC
ncbi:MAG TPA: hypothetical protein VFR08_07480, partial [Candidatus Angelobacter sp.]|nr:hypothetical protein [Candidatus Angelobacter sp.]